MNGLIAGAGLGLLIMLAAVVGYMLDREARDTAWRGIAAARRDNQETAHRLRAWAADLETRAEELDLREWHLNRRDRGPDTK